MATNWKTAIERAQAKHGGRYQYPSQPWNNSLNGRLKITCPTHGEFSQVARKHIAGQGCPRCAREARREIRDADDFIAQARAKHGDRYDYSKVVFKTPRTPVTIICPEHGDFEQKPAYHARRGNTCPKCATDNRRAGFDDFVRRAREQHGDKYSYTLQEYKRNDTKMRVVCPEHGEFRQRAFSHWKGSGCPKCSAVVNGDATRSNFSEFVRQAVAKHGGKYSYPPQPYVNNYTWVTISCPEHGDFEQTPSNHLKGHGCKQCSEGMNGSGGRLSLGEFAERAAAVHGGRYAYPEQEYKGQAQNVRIVCPLHGDFLQAGNNHLQGAGCPKCTKNISAGEEEVRQFVESLGLVTTRGRNRALQGLGSNEVDIIIAEKKVAVEYNGIYWHSTAGGKTKNYHTKKTELLESLGYQLIHVFEDEWKESRAIVEARLASILSPVSLPREFARRCVVKDISWSSAKDFLTKHHLQGSGSSGSVSLGLFRGDGLLAVSIFGKPRYDKSYAWELLRFASEGVVVGAAGKMLSFFSKRYATCGQKLISYADRRWSQGKLYQALGFEFTGDTAPGYGYVRAGKRLSRQKFQKHKLGKLFDNFDPALTEEENCRRNGYYRVYDCGVSRWVKTL